MSDVNKSLNTNVFKDPIKGTWIAQGLFLEPTYDTAFAIYTLAEYDKEYNGKLYLSLKKLYLEEEDITEYIFANKYLGGWSHWQRLQNNQQLAKEIDSWRTELELKLRAKALVRIKEQANKGSYNAAKYIANKEWENTGSGKGRPSKADIKREREKQAKIFEQYEEDAHRLGLMN